FAPTVLFKVAFFTHKPARLLDTGSLQFLTVVVLASTGLFVIWTTSDRFGNSAAAVQLWFVCCTVIGLSDQDIAAIVGSRWVLPIAKYLDVADKLPSPMASPDS